MRRCVETFIILLSAVISPARAATLCGPLDGPGCVPEECSVLDPRTCLPDQNYPFSADLRLTVASRAAAEVVKPDHALSTIRDLFAVLRACWSPPPLADAREDMQMSVRVSFKRSGDLIADPRVTYVTPAMSEEVRETYRKAIAQSLAACGPLHFTTGLAGAIAGRPIMIRYVDDRERMQR